MSDLADFANDYPCVMALGWGREVMGSEAFESLDTNIDSPLPYYLNVLRVGDGDPLQRLLEIYLPGGKLSIPILSLADGARGTVDRNIRTAQLLNQQLGAITSQSSFMVSSLNDWTGQLPLLFNPPPRSAYLHTEGITDSLRTPGLAYDELSRFINTELVNEDVTTEIEVTEQPWQFLIVGLFLSALGLWFMRFDNLFKQNIMRSLSHSQRFITDIRDRRFLQGSQTLVLLVLISAGVGNLVASLGYSLRLNPGISGLIEHLTFTAEVMEFLRYLLWMPGRGIFFFSAIAFLMALFYCVLIVIGASGQRYRPSFTQSLSVLIWSGVPGVIILPISAVYLRIETIGVLWWAAILTILLLLIWSMVRMIRALSIAYRASLIRPIFLVAGLPLCFLMVYLIQLQARLRTFDYLAYFYQLILSG
jgi:hypothetical protein